MNPTISKLIAVLILIQIASAQMTYDVRASSATETLFSEDSDSYKWLYKRALTGPSYQFQSVRYVPGQTGNKKTVTFTSANDMSFKAVSKDFTCAALYDATTVGSQKLNIVDLTTTNTNTVKQELVASTQVTTVTVANANTNTYEVANSCTAIKVQDSVYHFGGSPAKYRLDAPPTAGWTKVTFSGDFVWGAGNAGIYKYNSADAANLKYQLALASTFNDNKKIWTSSEGIVVLSWVASGTANINNYTLRFFNIPATGSITVISTLTGQYYNADAAKSPSVSISPNLKTVVVYDKTPADATKFFARGASISYTAKTLTEFTIPTWITATQSLVSVSDKYLFARNIVDNTATPPAKQVGYYFIAGAALTVYKAPATVTATDVITDWTRTKISQTRNGQLNVVIETVTAAKLITLAELPVPVPNTIQIFTWDKRNSVATRVVTGAGTAFYQHQSKPQWFLASKLVGTNYYFESVRADPASSFAAAKTTYTTDQTHVLKAVSSNYKCALIYESTTPSLKVVNFDVATTATLYATVTASLYSGIDLTAAATTFDVSDNCRAFRINTKVFHYYSDSSYYLDTYPVGTTSLTNPVFNADFSIAVTDSGIYKYTAKTVAADGIYNVDRADTFASVKKVYQDGNNYIITTQVAANNTHYNWKVQLNTIVNSTSIKVGEFTGTVQTQLATIKISPKLSKIIVQGYSATNATQVVYVGKTVDWLNRGVKDVTLPSAITSIKVPFALSDEFIYINKYETDKKHGAWAFMGTTIIEAVTLLDYQYPIIDYTKSWILPDQSGERKLIIAHQYSVGDFIRLFNDQRKSVSQILNPNPISASQMTFSYTGGASFKYPSFPYFGKWFYTTSTGTALNYVEYKTTETGKKKLVTKTGLTGDNSIVATSQNFDCALTYVAGSDLMTLKINSDYTVSTLSAWSAVTTADMTPTQVATAISNSKVGVGAACWAVRIGDLVYFKNAAGDAFTKSAKIATLTTPIFDATLTFAYAGGKVYQYTGSDYVEIITVSGLKSTVSIMTSEDKKKIIIFSYELTAVGATSYATVIRAYYYGTTWTSVTLPSVISDFTTYSGTPTAISEPTLETLGVWYRVQSGSGTKPQIYLAKADYTAGTLSLYENPAEWLGSGVSPSFSPFGNYLYVYRITNTLAGNIYTELFYKIDKANTKIVLISTRPISSDENSKIRNGKFIEQSGNIYALYEYHSGNDVTLIKRLLGSQSMQSTLRGIEAKDAGLLVQNGQVFLCPAGCSYCLNTNTCETCLPGFTLDSNKNCLRCSQLCSSCAATDLSTCTGCINGYALVGGACQQCSSDCLTCSTTTTSCTSCKVGYYVSSSRCLPCIDNCVSCNPSAATDALCNTCRKGYVYNSVTKTCVKCIAGCVNCNPLKVFECLKCGQGFDSTLTNGTLTCNKCPNNCVTCLGQQCSVCRNGFRLVNNTCIAQCKLPCQQCSTTDANKCTSCVGGYTLNGQACSPDLSCNTAKTCTSCPIGYNLIAGVCYQCNGGSNCRTCDNLNIEVCASCNKGYYLTSTYTCAGCNITGCVACSTELFCQQCKSGYVLSGPADSGKCVKCDDSCATCFDSPVNCQTCAQGYTKKGWNCINNNNIKVQLKVDAVFTSFSTTNYESIETQIAEKISKDRKHITIEQIKTGSVIVSMTINNNNLGQQASLLSTLQTALANGATIGGFTIQTSQLTAVNLDASGQPLNVYTTPNDSQAKRYRDIAIIVGVVIPVGLIILFIIFFILYKKGVICANEPTKVRDASMIEVNTFQKESSLHQMRKN